MTGTNRPRRVLSLSFLVVVLALISCARESSSDESPSTTAASSPDASAESTEPTATSPTLREGKGDGEDVAQSLVEAHVRERGGYDESVTIELEQEPAVVFLPGLSLHEATPLVPDMLGSHCAAYGEEVWCSEEALQNIVREFSLGSNPDQLSDKEWLALVAFFTYTAPLEGPDDLELIDPYIPDGIRATISSPMIDRPASGGLEITFYQEEVAYDAYPAGPMALSRVDVVVADDNTMTVQDRDVWVGTADTDD